MNTKFTAVENDYFALLRARDIVATRWRQNGFGKTGGPRCALGAVREATDLEMTEEGVIQYYRIEALLDKAAIDSGFHSIVGLNDTAANNQPVLNVFDFVIAQTEERCYKVKP